MKNICAWNNCFEIAKYKAPVEKDNSKKYKLLCLAHIKEFNKNWDYFSGMNDEEVYSFLKSDITWHKPTQSFSSNENFFKILWKNVLNEKINFNKYNNNYENKSDVDFDKNDIKAFTVLNLPIGLKWEKVQAKFKKLVKKFHPDMNEGNKKYEDKLKVITLAYTQLKKTYRAKIDT